MKKIVMMLAALSFTVGAAFAQTTPAAGQKKVKTERLGQEHKKHQTPEQKAEQAAKKMSQKLNLSAQQTEQVRQLHLARYQEMKARRGQGAQVDKAQAQVARKANRERYDAQLKQILSADQYTKYAQLRAERMEKHKGQGHKKAKAYKS